MALPLSGVRLLHTSLVAACPRMRGVVHVDHTAGAGADRQAGRAEVRGRVAGGVVLLVGVAGLDFRDQVTRVGLGGRVLALRPLAEERRKGDRGQDADDQDYDEELDQREAALLVVETLRNA